MAAALPVMMIGQGLMGVLGAQAAIKEGRQTEAAHNRQASYQEYQGATALAASRIQARQKQLEGDYLQGKQAGQFAAGGVVTNSGSAFQVLQDTEAQTAMSVATEEFSGDFENWAARTQAAESRFAGSQAAKAGKSKAIMGLLSTGVNMASSAAWGKSLTSPTGGSQIGTISRKPYTTLG